MNEQSIKRKQRALNQHRGIPNRVPAAEAAQHIASLRVTMSWTDLAAATGSSACHLRLIASGREPRINRGTHNKIMAVISTPGGWVFVDALGSRRRIHALQAIGHSQYVIADAAETTQYRIYAISNERTTKIRLFFADRITRAYAQLKDCEGTSTRGRNYAAKQGRLGPAYWDDDEFDNPDAEPAEMSRSELAAYRRQEIAHLASFGIPEREIAARLDLAGDYVHDLIRNMRKAA